MKHVNWEAIQGVANGDRWESWQYRHRNVAKECAWHHLTQEVAFFLFDVDIEFRPTRKPIIINGIKVDAVPVHKPGAYVTYYYPCFFKGSGVDTMVFQANYWQPSNLRNRNMLFATEAEAAAVSEAMTKPLREWRP